MYTNISEFYVIAPTARMMNDLYLTSYIAKKDSGNVKYSLQKKCQK